MRVWENGRNGGVQGEARGRTSRAGMKGGKGRVKRGKVKGKRGGIARNPISEIPYPISCYLSSAFCLQSSTQTITSFPNRKHPHPNSSARSYTGCFNRRPPCRRASNHGCRERWRGGRRTCRRPLPTHWLGVADWNHRSAGSREINPHGSADCTFQGERQDGRRRGRGSFKPVYGRSVARRSCADGRPDIGWRRVHPVFGGARSPGRAFGGRGGRLRRSRRSGLRHYSDRNGGCGAGRVGCRRDRRYRPRSPGSRIRRCRASHESRAHGDRTRIRRQQIGPSGSGFDGPGVAPDAASQSRCKGWLGGACREDFCSERRGA